MSESNDFVMNPTNFRPEPCERCGNMVNNIPVTCPGLANGYCKGFQYQAVADALKFNMHTPKYKKSI